MHGNAWEWTLGRFVGIPGGGSKGSKVVEDEDKEDIFSINKGTRVLRGGSFNGRAVAVRSAGRDWNAPAGSGYNLGFRPARTLTP
jgi:formylglycine-generating enzyme required for sulfatase activity